MREKSYNSNIECERSKPRKICDAISKYYEFKTTNRSVINECANKNILLLIETKSTVSSTPTKRFPLNL